MATADQLWKGGSHESTNKINTPTSSSTTGSTSTPLLPTTGSTSTTQPPNRGGTYPSFDDITQQIINANNPTTTITPTVTSTTTTSTTNTGAKNGSETVDSTTTHTTSSQTNSRTDGGSTSVTNATGQVSENTQANYDKYSGAYQESQTVTDAYQKLQNQINQRPGEFNSQYTDQLNNLYNQIMGRNPFSYSLKDDALFDIYKQRYDAAGETAMKDTMGQYAANTGGYANSAGESAGFAAYQGYMNELNNTIPELYQMAYNRYKDQVDIDFNKYDITKGREDSDYGKYRDQVADWASDRDFLQGQYTDERNFDYKQWDDYRDFWQNELWKEKESQWTTDETNWSETVSNTVTTDTTNTVTERNWHEDPYTVTTTTNNVSSTSVVPGSGGSTSNKNSTGYSYSTSDKSSNSGGVTYTGNEYGIIGYDENGTPIIRFKNL